MTGEKSQTATNTGEPAIQPTHSMAEVMAFCMIGEYYEQTGYPLDHFEFRVVHCDRSRWDKVTVTIVMAKMFRPESEWHRYECVLSSEPSDEGPVLHKSVLRFFEQQRQTVPNKIIPFREPLSSFTRLPRCDR